FPYLHASDPSLGFPCLLPDGPARNLAARDRTDSSSMYLASDSLSGTAQHHAARGWGKHQHARRDCHFRSPALESPAGYRAADSRDTDCLNTSLTGRSKNETNFLLTRENRYE